MQYNEIDLRELPADVQDILRDRAIKEGRAIALVIRDYVLEITRHINSSAKEKGGEA